MTQASRHEKPGAAPGSRLVVNSHSGEGVRERRFPFNSLVSKQEVFLAYSAVAFPVFSWAILQYLEKMTSWLYYLTIGEVLSLLAYALLFAWIESMLITSGLVLLAAILPGSLLRNKFVPLTMAMIVPLTLAAVIAHYFENNLRQMPFALLGGGIALYGIITVGFYLGVQRVPIVAKAFQQLADRISVLVYLYLPLSIVSLLVIIVRNV
jgi:hypothetical protein